jgi:FMN phosphatase YigB (HAD superfamily)
MLNKLLILDFDGVLAHINLGKVYEATIDHYKDFSVPVDTIIDKYFYHNSKNIDLDLGRIKVNEVREQIRSLLWSGTREKWFNWWNLLDNGYEISLKMQVFLSKAQNANVPIILMTDNHLDFREWYCKRCDLSRWVDYLVCSAEIGFKKPSWEILKEALRYFPHVNMENVIYLDDDFHNVETYKAYGISAIHFKSDEILDEIVL